MLAAFQSLPCRQLPYIRVSEVSVGDTPIVGASVQCYVDIQEDGTERAPQEPWGYWTHEECTIGIQYPRALSGDRRVVLEGWLSKAGIRREAYVRGTCILPILRRFAGNGEVFIDTELHGQLESLLDILNPNPPARSLRNNPAAAEEFRKYTSGPMLDLQRQHSELLATESCPVCLEEGFAQPEEVFITPCVHVFHLACYREHCANTPEEVEVRCPMCRGPVPSPV